MCHVNRISRWTKPGQKKALKMTLKSPEQIGMINQCDNGEWCETRAALTGSKGFQYFCCFTQYNNEFPQYFNFVLFFLSLHSSACILKQRQTIISQQTRRSQSSTEVFSPLFVAKILNSSTRLKLMLACPFHSRKDIRQGCFEEAPHGEQTSC